MKKIIVILIISVMSFAGVVYAKGEKSDNKTMTQEEKTDKNYTKKVADEIKSLNKK